MPVIKCKMCGGDLNIVDDSSVCECEYCGTKQTVPKVDDEKKLKLFERANRLRTACEFDKAAGVYESIVADFDEEAEAYWGLILCKFGIEYVDDPATGNKIPTCHRSSFDSLMDDPNFDMVMECADPIARKVYREEARQIEELRKRIIEVSSQEEPYDIFISYKELDDEGQRTLDSVIAQDIYSELTEKGYRVFFSRISLEDKLGVEYEPYIFAALNSAKVMLVVGTDFDYFNAVWVKNEWSRFLMLIASGQKKTLIPVFKGIDAYDMPKEFRKLAAQDMGKVGAMQDLVRGVEKLLGKGGAAETPKEQPVIVQSGGPNVTALLGRGCLALEDENWAKARELFDQVLNMDFQNADAYLGLTLASEKCSNTEQYIDTLCSFEPEERRIVIQRQPEEKEEMIASHTLPSYLEREWLIEILNQHEEYTVIADSIKEGAEHARERFSGNRDLSRAFRYASGETKNKLTQMKTAFEAKLNTLTASAEQTDETAKKEAEERFNIAKAEADRLANEAFLNATEKRDADNQKACELARSKKPYDLFRASELFEKLGDQKHSAEAKAWSEAMTEYEKISLKIERYQQGLNAIEEEIKHAPIIKRSKMRNYIKWYQDEIEKLERERRKYLYD